MLGRDVTAAGAELWTGGVSEDTGAVVAPSWGLVARVDGGASVAVCPGAPAAAATLRLGAGIGVSLVGVGHFPDATTSSISSSFQSPPSCRWRSACLRCATSFKCSRAYCSTKARLWRAISTRALREPNRWIGRSPEAGTAGRNRKRSPKAMTGLSSPSRAPAKSPRAFASAEAFTCAAVLARSADLAAATCTDETF